MDDDFELEISRLGDRPSSAPQGTEAEPAESPQAERDSQTDATSHLHSPGAPHVRKLVRAGAVGLVVTLTLAVILVSFPGIGERLGGPFHHFAPTPTVPPGSDIILLAHTVPWGELHLERPDLHPLYLGYRERYPAYRLPPGRHRLFYVAAPFSPMQCTLSVPRRSDDDCKLATSRNGIANDLDASTRLIDAGASVKQLDLGARHELQTLLETGVAYPPLTIEPGTHYLDQSGKVAVADERLTVTMSMGAATPPSNAAIVDDDMQQCREICNLDSAQDYLTWKVTIWAAPHWTYVSADGDTFTAYGAPAQDQGVASVLWQGGKWVLDTQNGLGAPCDFRVFIELLSEKSGSAGLDTFTQYGGNSPVVANPANGCVLEFHAQENPGDHPRPEVLYRLGVLLATNADAQRIFPDLPVASATERDIAQAIRTGAVQ
ncbi:MAG TPA: hypothetical protein VHR15_07275 [Ktedonobacterales bacterium]|jgi:hypothetical protein|nr:hypothetical protein [Ktedonobacterales bacterium]